MQTRLKSNNDNILTQKQKSTNFSAKELGLLVAMTNFVYNIYIKIIKNIYI